jgi:hypothetical protein
MPRKLQNLKLNRAELLSVVDKGASGNDDLRPKIVLFKRAGQPDQKPEPQPKIESIVAGVLKALGIKKQEITKMTADEVIATLPEEQQAVMREALAAAALKTDDPAPEEKEMEGLSEKEKATVKSLPEEHRGAVIKSLKAKKADPEKAELQKRVERMEAENEEKELRAVAKRFESVPGASNDERVSLLKAAKAQGQEHYDAIVKQFEAMDRVVSKSEVFRTYGNPTVVEGSAVDEVEKGAAKLMAEDGKLSKGAARAKFLDNRPDLAKRYVEETQAH